MASPMAKPWIESAHLHPDVLKDGTLELPMVTLGDDYANIGRFCAGGGSLDYGAADVIRILGG